MKASIESSVDTAVAYYQAMNRKDLAEMSRHLHPDIQLVSPLDSLTGRQAVLDAAQRFLPAVKNIDVRAQFGSEKQAMLVYDMVFNEPLGVCRTAALITFQGDLIVRNELFFDARPFERK
ncbi:MAG: nuclear transport factor 2 family protein [Terracidiphilus sp.]